MISPPVSEIELSAYVDGEVSSVRREALEAWIAMTPAAAARVETFRRQKQQLRTCYGAPRQPRTVKLRTLRSTRPEAAIRKPNSPGAAEPLQETSLQETSRQESSRQETSHLAVLREAQRGRLALVTAGSFLAGAAVALVAAAFIGYAPTLLDSAHPGGAQSIAAIMIADPAQTMAARAILMHRTFALDAAKPVEFAARGADLASVLARRTGIVLAPPDLSSMGLTLLGGRIVPGDLGAAGLLVYETQLGERMSVYFSQSGGLTIPTPMLVDAQTSVILWTVSDKAIALSGRGGRDRLGPIVDKIRAQMSAPASR